MVAVLLAGDTLTLRTRATGGVGNLGLQRSPPDNLSCTNCPKPLFTALDTGLLRYRITASDANGCVAIGSLTISVDDSCLVYWPNAFTPDGDDINDRFYLLTFPCVYRIASLNIYSRWGDEVFSRTDFAPNDASAGWDGRTADGTPFPIDVLFWNAVVRYYDGRTEAFKGQVTLLR